MSPAPARASGFGFGGPTFRGIGDRSGAQPLYADPGRGQLSGLLPGD